MIKKRIKTRISVLLCVSLLASLFWMNTSMAASNPYPLWNDATTRSCTSIAWQKVYDTLGIALPGNWGNAGSWYNSASAAGYSVGGEARKDSLAVWTGGKYGHVAYVLDVESNNNFYIYEGGNKTTYGSPGVGSRWIKNGSEGSGKRLAGFIYLTSGASGNSNHTVQILEAKTAGQDDGGYMMYCKVDDETAVKSIQCASWANAGGTGEAKYNDMVHMDTNVYKVYVSYSLFRSEATVYYNDINITSYNGEVTRATMIVNAKKNVQPQILTASLAGEDSDGYMTACTVADEYVVKEVRIITWTDVGGESKSVSHPMVRMDEKLYKCYIPYKEHDLTAKAYYNRIVVIAVNDNKAESEVFVKNNGVAPTIAPTNAPKPSTSPTKTPKPTSSAVPAKTPKPTGSAVPAKTPKPTGSALPTPTPASGTTAPTQTVAPGATTNPVTTTNPTDGLDDDDYAQYIDEINESADAAYMSVINQRCVDSSEVVYTFIDITGDDIHEALIEHHPSNTGSGRVFEIHTYKSGKVKKMIEIPEYGMTKVILYKKSKGFALYWNGHGGEGYDYYKKKGNKYLFVAGKARSGRYTSDDDYGPWSYSAPNGEELTKHKYMRKIRKISSGKKKVLRVSKWTKMPDN